MDLIIEGLYLHPVLILAPAALAFTIYLTLKRNDAWFFRRPSVIIAFSLIGVALGTEFAWRSNGLIEMSPIIALDEFLGPLRTANNRAEGFLIGYFDFRVVSEPLIAWAVTAALLVPRITRVLFLAFISTWWFFDIAPYLALAAIHVVGFILFIALFIGCTLLVYGGWGFRR